MGQKQSSNFLGFLSSLLVFLFIRDIQARKLQQVFCSSSCGDIKNIRHPFRLKGDPAGCGDADYELACLSNKTILEFHSGKYYVKRISYDRHVIRVVDVNLANGSCGLPSHSLSGDSIYSDNRYGISHHDYKQANFVRCSRNISDNTSGRLPCFNKNQSNVFVTYSDLFYTYLSDLPQSCSCISTIPINYSSGEIPSYEVINKLLQSGFDLIWSDKCQECESAGKHCYRRLNSRGQLKSHCAKLGTSFLILILSVALVAFLRIIVLLQGLVFFLGLCFYFPFPYLQLDNGPFDIFFGLFSNFNLWEVVVGLITRSVFVMVFVVLIICKYKTTKKTVDNVEKFLSNQRSWMPRRYSYIEIIAITNHFRNKLGQGGFGTVYKAQLLNGSLVAVKVLENSKFSGEEFINEVSTIGRIHHSNVVRLVGFCSEGSKRALIYEYMPNGSLDRYIFSKKDSDQSFSWKKLHEIAIGTAHGIEYLHNGCDVCILHFDIKPHNILLDHNFVPKVADFGLARFHPKENDFICVSATRGTIGYIAPELISKNFGAVSCKSDVYSFGMLLLEMAGGRRNSFAKASHSSKAYFPSWVYDRIIERRDLELQNVSEIEEVIARKLCIIGLWCIQVKATARPSITKVVEMLEGNIDDLQMPPKPFFSSSPQHHSIREIQSDSSTELFEYSESIEECSFIAHGSVV